MTTERGWRLPAVALLSALSLLLVACGSDSEDDPLDPAEARERALQSLENLDGARIAAANDEPGNWLSHGRTWDEQRHSPLTQIDRDNVGQLELAWHFDTGVNRGHEASPLAVDGILYFTVPWSVVYALDSRTGELLWKYDPEVPKSWGVNACCDVVNRGLAAWKGRLYLGTLDGRLVALDGRSGEVVWQVQTTDPAKPYTITGAPRVVKGKVIIGNGGAEFGVRGYVSAYDAETGEQLWRFYTVPGDPRKGFESRIMERAARTWSGRWWEVGGGGGTVWDSLAYDPELDLLYIGVGNGAPLDRGVRSPGGGDNLFLASIVALRPDTGKYVWHFQTAPGDTWDYTATQHMVLADLEIGHRMRKVLMQAPKNGFFYVLDRATGEFLSGAPYVRTTWAEGLDRRGRPIESAAADYGDKPTALLPGPQGGHNWHPMAFNPETGLVYIPAQDVPFVYQRAEDFEARALAWNTGYNLLATMQNPELLEPLLPLGGRLLAWDPVRQQAAWTVEHELPGNGGLLSTAGGLVFQGDLRGQFSAWDARSGDKLWSRDAQGSILAPPISYSVDGRQHVAVLVGFGGALGLNFGLVPRPQGSHPTGRLLVYALDGGAQLPPLAPPDNSMPPLPPEPTDAAEVSAGRDLYHVHCWPCHGVNAVSTILPDLRRMSPETRRDFRAIVLGGKLNDLGMVSFASLLDEREVRNIHSYLLSRSHETLKAVDDR